MKNVLLMFLAVSALALSACSGSGGGGNTAATPTATNTVSPYGNNGVYGNSNCLGAPGAYCSPYQPNSYQQNYGCPPGTQPFYVPQTHGWSWYNYGSTGFFCISTNYWGGYQYNYNYSYGYQSSGFAQACDRNILYSCPGYEWCHAFNWGSNLGYCSY